MRIPAAIAMLTLLAPAAHAVIVDRIAVAVGNKVITQSEIEKRIRLTAFQNKQAPDLSLQSRKEAAQRLIDQKLVEREMDVGHFPPIDAERGQQLLVDYERTNYPEGHEAMLRALAADGLAASDVEEDLMRQANLLTFLDLRFRPAVQVGDEEVRKYFEEKIPAGSSEDEATLSTMRASIEQLLANQRADKDMEEWLADQRARLHIEYVDKDLQP